MSNVRCQMPMGLLIAALAVGWSLREAQFAAAQGKKVANGVVNRADVTRNDAQDAGKATGKAGVYVDGATAPTKNLQVGRFTLNPGATPHAPHRHADEELMLVARGTGEIFCDGKTYPVRPGALMFADPNVEHAIKNTGEMPLEFYWVKYLPNK